MRNVISYQITCEKIFDSFLSSGGGTTTPSWGTTSWKPDYSTTPFPEWTTSWYGLNEEENDEEKIIKEDSRLDNQEFQYFGWGTSNGKTETGKALD